MSAIYDTPGEVRWIEKDGVLVLQQLWRKTSAPAVGEPRVRDVWRTVPFPEGYVMPLIAREGNEERPS